MKPLMIMVTCNRLESTKLALASLQATTGPDELELQIVDNGSTDGTVEWFGTQDFSVDCLEENVGCPQALNRVLEKWRKPGQHVIKLDNDVEILTPGWLPIWLDFLNNVPNVAMIGGFHRGMKEAVTTVLAYDYLRIASMGNFVLYSGAFMDHVGYFDVLAPNHLYGFEDNIMVAKAYALRWLLVVLKEVQWEHRQSSWGPSYDKRKHIEEMRPLFNQRSQALGSGANIYTGPDGRHQ